MTLYHTDSFVFFSGEIIRAPNARPAPLRKFSREDIELFFNEANKIQKTSVRSIRLQRLQQRWRARSQAQEDLKIFNPKDPNHWQAVNKYDV